MKFIINNIRLSLDDDINALKSAAAKKLRISAKDFKSFKITKESVDARRKPSITLIYSVLVEVQGKAVKISSNDVRTVEENKEESLAIGGIPLKNRPIVVGSGPAGLFAGLILAQNGYRPLVLERGECVEKRTEIVHRYWEKGELDTETNVQFGEGGAGTFSDGKLTTRINDRRCEKVLEELYNSGAQEEILYKSRPHIGTDVLKKVVVNMRKRIEQYGGEVRFNTKVTSLKIEGSAVVGVEVNGSEMIDSQAVVLAVGHSARDTFDALLKNGVSFIQKPFSIGVRIEHPQELIDKAQYGSAAGHTKLGAADYQLFYKTSGRTAYSFCMCPGGIVVASASENGTIVTNGMSEFARDRENANSALVVSVEPGDFGGSHPLAGVEFQRRWERLAYEVGGKNGSAPIQKLGDFLDSKPSTSLGSVRPSYTGRVALADINLCLPEFITRTMKESIGYFDNKLKGFGMKEAVLTGVETRTSSPVRIPRGDSLEAEGIKGLYPTGEGAGYAGGIVSAAVDGIRVAERIISEYAPLG
ncbi:MAG: FAD-dependent oxidoreductase [Clostridia bacterium]|nr:FAD-dependent oxidoreductase [Clostridia bacterium]